MIALKTATSLAHTDADVEFTLEAVRKALLDVTV